MGDLQQRAEIPIGFLFLFAPATLERLFGSDAYLVTRRDRLHAGKPTGLSWSLTTKESGSMMDIILIGTAVGFFGLCFAYTQACDRL